MTIHFFPRSNYLRKLTSRTISLDQQYSKAVFSVPLDTINPSEHQVLKQALSEASNTLLKFNRILNSFHVKSEIGQVKVKIIFFCSLSHFCGPIPHFFLFFLFSFFLKLFVLFFSNSSFISFPLYLLKTIFRIKKLVCVSSEVLFYLESHLGMLKKSKSVLNNKQLFALKVRSFNYNSFVFYYFLTPSPLHH